VGRYVTVVALLVLRSPLERREGGGVKFRSPLLLDSLERVQDPVPCLSSRHIARVEAIVSALGYFEHGVRAVAPSGIAGQCPRSPVPRS
jgi:hypothetical protein